MAARYLQSELEVHPALGGRPCFLDSDDLKDLRLLKEAVKDSDCLILIQSRRVLERPWCLIELVTAIEHRVPIVGVSLVGGTEDYDFSEAAAYLSNFIPLLGAQNPAAPPALLAEGFELVDVAWKLSTTLPHIISTPFNPSASLNVLKGTVMDIVDAMHAAQHLDSVEPFEEWEARQRQTCDSRHRLHGSSHQAVRAAVLAVPISVEVPSIASRS